MNSLRNCAGPLRMRCDSEIQRKPEHCVRCYSARDAPENLSGDVEGSIAPADSTFQCVGKRNHRIQMCAGNCAEREYQRHKRRARSDRIGQQSHRHIAAREPLRHDARTDHGGHQKRSAQKLRRIERPRLDFIAWPIRSISFWMASLSRLARGRRKKQADSAIKNHEGVAEGAVDFFGRALRLLRDRERPNGQSSAGQARWGRLLWPRCRRR